MLKNYDVPLPVAHFMVQQELIIEEQEQPLFKAR